MLIDKTCGEFAEVLASAEPVPGGGGAAALTGAMGAALGEMVVNLTLKSKKYAEFHSELAELRVTISCLRTRLLKLVDDDAEAFAPLAAAYKLPKDDPNRAMVMENALGNACVTPFDIMNACAEMMPLFAVLREKGTKMAVSDVYAGETLCKAAIKTASYNIYINTELMSDREKAGELDDKSKGLVEAWNC